MAEPASSDGPQTLRELAESIGISPEEIDRTEADGTLGLLVVDRLAVPEPGIYTQAEMDDLSGLGEEARRFWRALGFPDPDPEERVFSQMDVEMLQLVDAMLRLELVEPDTALQVTRVIGSSIERVAQAQVDAIEARINDDDSSTDERLAVLRASMLLPTIPRVLEYSWRRHFQSAARRSMVRDSMADRRSAHRDRRVRRPRRVHRPLPAARRPRARLRGRPLRGDGVRPRRRAAAGAS